MLSEVELIEAVRKFEALEKNFLKYTYETEKPLTDESKRQFIEQAFHIAEQAYRVKQEILESFGQISDVRVSDQSVQRVLEKIRTDEQFYSISFYEGMVEILHKDIDNEEHLPDTGDVITDLIDKKWDSLFDDFISRFSINDYYYAKMRIGPIISSFKVPKNLIVYFDEIRETFAFGQYRATIALCRALLEMCLYQKLKAKGAFVDRGTTKVVPIENAKKDSLFKYINMAQRHRLLSQNEAGTAHLIRDNANKVLHVKEEPIEPREADTIDIILNTMSILQKLYR